MEGIITYSDLFIFYLYSPTSFYFYLFLLFFKGCKQKFLFYFLIGNQVSIKIESSTSVDEETFENQPEEVDPEPNHSRIYTRFRIIRRPNGRVVNKVAILYLRAPYPEKSWRQELDLKSFEVMHGLSRVALLIPDKLATAMVINKENLADPDDGGFLIGLVIDLVHFYRDKMVGQVQQEEGAERTTSRVINFGSEDQQILMVEGENIGILEVLNIFLCRMTLLQVSLSMRNEEEINFLVQQILQMADDILEFSTAYMEFVQPLYLDIERRGVFDEAKVRELKFSLVRKLARNKRKIQLEFESLLSPRESES